MIPIGIVTKDRVAYLDVTLRSLSATDLPEDISITVFDDASVNSKTHRYYGTKDKIAVIPPWPTTTEWKNAGLHIVNHPHVPPTGLLDRVHVEPLGKRPLGVVSASCEAVNRLFDRHPEAPGIILLQDDVLFKKDWYTRLIETARNWRDFSDKPIGVMAGLKLNHVYRPKPTTPAVPSGITAQCLYIARPAYNRVRGYFNKKHKQQIRFDDTLRSKMRRAGYWAGCIYPFVCQHIGIVSLVRPGRSWTRRPKGRIGYYVHPPYALSSEVKALK